MTVAVLERDFEWRNASGAGSLGRCGCERIVAVRGGSAETPVAGRVCRGQRRRRLDEDRWVYLWADGIYSGLRAEAQKLCALVAMGANERGEKRFLAIEDGVREATQSWREMRWDLKQRGLEIAPA